MSLPKRYMIASTSIMVNLLAIALAVQVSNSPSLDSSRVEKSITSIHLREDFQIPHQFEVFNPLPVQVNAAETITITNGVASGEVTTTSAILWTRLSQTGTLTTQVATDPTFSSLVFQEPVTVTLDTDFTASILAAPLEDNQTYYYRWLAGSLTSDIGTFKTPPAGSLNTDLRFAFSGDTDGTMVNSVPYYNNFETLEVARLEKLDFFIYLGDTIYADSTLRPNGEPAATLDQYRQTYQVNRQIDALRGLLESTSIFAIWDDHEVLNDYAGQTVDQFRYDNGRQAFLEYIPVWDGNIPSDPSCAGDPLFRVFPWGKDIEIIILDERSCRSESAVTKCPFLFGIPDLFPTLPPELRGQYPLISDNPPDGCLEAINDPGRTMLGQVQKQIFLDTLFNSSAKYKFVINEVPIQQLYFRPYDRWEGYSAERQEILNFIKINKIKNVIFLTGDLHANIINEVFIDHFDDPEPVAMEFVTGPIATQTFEENIPWIVKNLSLDAINDTMNLVGVDCRDLDVYSYGLVEIDSLTGIPTITLKDDTGTTLVDTRDQVSLCTKTLGSNIFLPIITYASLSQSNPR